MTLSCRHECTASESVIATATTSEAIAELDERCTRTNVIEPYRLAQTVSVTSKGPVAIRRRVPRATSKTSPIVPKDSIDVNDYGAYDTTTIAKTIKSLGDA